MYSPLSFVATILRQTRNRLHSAPCFPPSRHVIRCGSAQNPENLLIFAAGNLGAINDGRTVCTIGSPAIGKNALAVGATSAGETRLTLTGADGEEADGTNGYADVDTLAWFSSYGPTRDGRIKPEVVAAGDAVRTSR